MSEAQQWFWCLPHGRVETEPDAPFNDRLGPYGSRVEAERALQHAQERTEAWDKDPRWNDED